MLLGESLEDYLECIVILAEKGKVRSIDIARMMNVSKPSVNKAMNNLKEKGFLTQETYGDIHLTKKGEDMAKKVHNRHTTIRRFLLDVVGVDAATAEKDACRIEHIISEETFIKITEMTKKNND